MIKFARSSRVSRKERDNELVAEASSLIASSSSVDAGQAIEEILWHRARAYRVAITAIQKYCGKTGIAKLFRGYQNVVGGDVERRQVEVRYLDDLRKWVQINTEGTDVGKKTLKDTVLGAVESAFQFG